MDGSFARFGAVEITPESEPLSPDAIRRQAHLFAQAGQYGKAIRLYRTLIKSHPARPTDYMELGIIYRKSGRFHACLGCYNRAIDLGMPPSAEYHTRMGNILKDLYQHDRALWHAEQAVRLSNDRIILLNYAVLLREMKRFSEAVEVLDSLLDRFPDDAELAWERAFVSLYIRHDEEAWHRYEVRRKTERLPNHPVMDVAASWQGENLSGKRLYLLQEQGFGDTLLMLRYLPLLKAQGAHITLEVKPDLSPLLRETPVDAFVEPGEIEAAGYDYYCPLMSLPYCMGTTPDTIPEPAALTIPQEAKDKVAAELVIPNDNKLNVGVVWSGSVTFGNNRNRAVAVKRFLDLAAGQGDARFFSLQKGPPQLELKRSGGDFLINDVSPLLSDFGITAAVIQDLDLIVMTDSSVAHLTGSLGKPVLNLLNHAPYWLYMPETPKTAWYPSMRLLRQSAPGAWDAVFNQTNEILEDLAKEKRQAGGLKPTDVLSAIDRRLEAI